MVNNFGRSYEINPPPANYHPDPLPCRAGLRQPGHHLAHGPNGDEFAAIGWVSDRVQLDVPLSADGTGPYTVTAELLYQAIGYRWAENLRPYNTAEAGSFFMMYDAADKTPVVVESIEYVIE